MKKKVFYAHAANYALWGRMFRVIADRAKKYGWWGEELSFSLGEAKAQVRLFKAGYGHIFGENIEQALALTEYGYTGNLPGGGLPCSSRGEITEPAFEWKWLPYHDP